MQMEIKRNTHSQDNCIMIDGNGNRFAAQCAPCVVGHHPVTNFRFRSRQQSAASCANKSALSPTQRKENSKPNAMETRFHIPQQIHENALCNFYALSPAYFTS